MREEEKQRSRETVAREKLKDLQAFPIMVKNLFDEDPKYVKVFHKDKDNKEKAKHHLIHIVGKNQQKQQEGIGNQQIQQECNNVEKYDLSHGDYLVIELGKEEVEFRKSKKDVYIGLPFLADYEFFWEVETGGEKKQVARPISFLRRDTHTKKEEEEEKKQKQTKKGRTVLKIPADQRAWRLKILRPGNLDRYYREEKIISEDLQMESGDHDDVTVGDNGEG